MNREKYKAAFDQIPFSPDLQARTEALLWARLRETEKETQNMNFSKPKKLAVLAAAAVALLAVSVSAVLFLTPADVAERLEDAPLAAAFQSDDVVVLNETAASGDYTFTLLGMVSGEDLSALPAEYNGETVRDRTYAVFTVARTDGTPLAEQPELSYSPLVAGYHVSAVNGWTLGATCQSFVEDGVAYYLFDTQNLEIFADHTVYFAIYEGFVPSPAQFPTAEDGAISLAEDVTGALFTLPLDAGKADPTAAEAFVKSTGLEFISGGEAVETEDDAVLSEN
ncbi:hypothetical protein [Oscillibacter sp.]|uniref:hypothetical protein n=1 Tax=Oscillibacter sp. TaxID=1945593 RepID=UPI001B7893F0|nr:hypothetical protein [Oscillibacter sp.]MBP3509515.1 hypothetical protein [Oscillibacter sp.]